MQRKKPVEISFILWLKRSLQGLYRIMRKPVLQKRKAKKEDGVIIRKENKSEYEFNENACPKKREEKCLEAVRTPTKRTR